MEGVGGDVGDRETGVVLSEGSDEVCTHTMVILTLLIRTQLVPVKRDCVVV